MYKKKRLDTCRLNDSGDEQFTISWGKEFQIGIMLTKKENLYTKVKRYKKWFRVMATEGGARVGSKKGRRNA